MRTKSKLAALELVVGIFGWIWIVAAIAALYFLAMAVFSGGEWPLFFWALGAGIVAKWLARGFDDSKKRAAYEAKLVAEGCSPEEAAKRWLQEYSGNSQS